MGRIKEVFLNILNRNNGEFPKGYTLQQYLEDEETIKNDQETQDDTSRETGTDLLTKSKEETDF